MLEPVSRRPSALRRLVRLVSWLAIGGGIATLAWAGVVWRWEDPFTGAYTAYQQAKLESRYRELASAYGAGPGNRPSVAARARELSALAGRGQPIGRLRVPAIGVDMLVVNGTDAASLKRGPGRYAGTRADLGSYAGAPPPASMPGEGQLVYVAGHRTTYGAPFADIDKIARGDRVRFELPYAVFDYVVSEKRIVAASETAVLRSRGVEEIVLQACHPRFSAARRYLVYAKAVRVTARAPA